MTNPKCKCEYCGYEGRFEIDIYYLKNGKLCCVDCGTDDLKRMVLKKIESENSKKD